MPKDRAMDISWLSPSPRSIRTGGATKTLDLGLICSPSMAMRSNASMPESSAAAASA